MTVAPVVTATRIETPEDVEILRQIRNATRGTYSFSNTEISTTEQDVWWAKYRENLIGYLIAVDGETAAYAVLTIMPEAIPRAGLPRKLEACATTVVGVLPAFRGMGLVYRAMDLLEGATELPLVACARLDNPAGIKAHRASSGWRETHRDLVHVYFRRDERRSAPADAELELCPECSGATFIVWQSDNYEATGRCTKCGCERTIP